MARRPRKLFKLPDLEEMCVAFVGKLTHPEQGSPPACSGGILHRQWLVELDRLISSGAPE